MAPEVERHAAVADDALMVPELGPSLGRLTDPPAEPPAPGPLGLTLDDIRLGLVTELFDLAGAARSAAARGDRQGAVTSLGRAGCLGAWERAVAAAATRIAGLVDAAFRAAAAESRLPARRLQRLLLTPADARAVAARLGAGGSEFVAALDALDAAVPDAVASGESGRAAWDTWVEALGAAARRVETAWVALETAAALEERRWREEVERVRMWRRPTGPLWAITALAIAVATYVGLVLGGYLPVPDALRGFAEFWWGRP